MDWGTGVIRDWHDTDDHLRDEILGRGRPHGWDEAKVQHFIDPVRESGLAAAD
jgi:hypothetical protein